MDENKIKCRLRPLTEFSTALTAWNPNKKKMGRYSCSRWSNTPKKQYVVLARLDADDFEHRLGQGLEQKELLKRCLNFLNTPPPRKKFGKSAPKSVYGKLDLYRASEKE